MTQIHSPWTASDIQKNTQPLRYRSDYFLHFAASTPGETQITVLGDDLVVVDGRRWSVVGDVFFVAARRASNVLPVLPSPADKRTMLGHVPQLLR